MTCVIALATKSECSTLVSLPIVITTSDFPRMSRELLVTPLALILCGCSANPKLAAIFEFMILMDAPASASAVHLLPFTSALIVVVRQVRLSKIPNTWAAVFGGGVASHCPACLVHEGQAMSCVPVISSSAGYNLAGGVFELMLELGIVSSAWG